MGRDTEIYMFNKETASLKLYNVLKSGKLYKRSFKDFIENRKSELGNSYQVNYSNIVSTVKEDINNITACELFEITYYLNEELTYGKYEDQKNDLRLQIPNSSDVYKRYGIISLYRVHTSTVCYSYMFQYGNYTAYYPIEEVKFNKDDEGMNISAEDFLRFNDYMILIMKHILNSGIEDNFNPDEYENSTIDKTEAKYRDNTTIFDIIEKQFNYLKSYFEEPDERSNAPQKNTIYFASLFLTRSIEMKLNINPSKNKRIVIVDSC